MVRNDPVTPPEPGQPSPPSRSASILGWLAMLALVGCLAVGGAQLMLRSPPLVLDGRPYTAQTGESYVAGVLAGFALVGAVVLTWGRWRWFAAAVVAFGAIIALVHAIGLPWMGAVVVGPAILSLVVAVAVVAILVS